MRIQNVNFKFAFNKISLPMVLAKLLFLLTEYEDELQKLDPEFMDRVVAIVNKIQSNEQKQIADLPRGGDTDREE